MEMVILLGNKASTWLEIQKMRRWNEICVIHPLTLAQTRRLDEKKVFHVNKTSFSDFPNGMSAFGSIWFRRNLDQRNFFYLGSEKFGRV